MSHLHNHHWPNKNAPKDNTENISGINFKRVSYLVHVTEANFWLHHTVPIPYLCLTDPTSDYDKLEQN